MAWCHQAQSHYLIQWCLIANWNLGIISLQYQVQSHALPVHWQWYLPAPVRTTQPHSREPPSRRGRRARGLQAAGCRRRCTQTHGAERPRGSCWDHHSIHTSPPTAPWPEITNPMQTPAISGDSNLIMYCTVRGLLKNSRSKKFVKSGRVTHMHQ